MLTLENGFVYGEFNTPGFICKLHFRLGNISIIYYISNQKCLQISNTLYFKNKILGKKCLLVS